MRPRGGPERWLNKVVPEKDEFGRPTLGVGLRYASRLDYRGRYYVPEKGYSMLKVGPNAWDENEQKFVIKDQDGSRLLVGPFPDPQIMFPPDEWWVPES